MAEGFTVPLKLKIDGEASFREAMKTCDSAMKALGAEGKKLSEVYSENAESLEALTKAQENAAQKVEVQKQKVEALKQALEDAFVKSGGEATEHTNKLNAQLSYAEAQLSKLEKEERNAREELEKHSTVIGKAKDAYNNAKKSVEEFKDAHPKTAKAIEAVNSAAGKLAKGGLKAISTAAKATAAAVGAVATGMVAIGKQAVESYAQYEQLTGSVETLFKDSSSQVLEYAQNAYKTAGINANEYLETVTNFSASLLKSLEGDTEKAAEVANLAVSDMSDNAAKFGTDIESIQNAYQGFAKQNYTMLDNLKLGYAGTKEGMQELIDDANKLKEANGEMGDLTIDSYADIVEAIHLVQEEMGVTGTAANEASETISGSINATKAAYDNLVTGLADDNADIGALVEDLISSASNVIENLMPVLETTLSNIAIAIAEVAPTLITTLCSGILDNLDVLFEAALEIVDSLVTNILTEENIQKLVDVAMELVLDLVTYLSENAGQLIDAAATLITTLMNAFSEPDNMQTLVNGVIDLVGNIVTSLIENAPMLIEAAWEMGKALVNALIDYDWLSLAKSIYNSIKSAIIGFFTGGNDDGGHAGGLDYVPFSGYQATLHRGERVLTAAEAEAQRNNNSDISQLNAKVDYLMRNQQNGDVNINVSGSAGAIVRALNVEIEREGRRKSAWATA